MLRTLAHLATMAALGISIVFVAQQYQERKEAESHIVYQHPAPRVPGPAETLAHVLAPLFPAPVEPATQAPDSLPPLPVARPAQAPDVEPVKTRPGAQAAHKRRQHVPQNGYLRQ